MLPSASVSSSLLSYTNSDREVNGDFVSSTSKVRKSSLLLLFIVGTTFRRIVLPSASVSSSLLSYTNSDPAVNGDFLSSTSQVRKSNLLFLFIVGN